VCSTFSVEKDMEDPGMKRCRRKGYKETWSCWSKKTCLYIIYLL